MKTPEPPTDQHADLYFQIFLSHLRSFWQCVRIEWEGLFAVVQSLSLVIGQRCDTCGKVRRVLWTRSGNHALCGRLSGWGQGPDADPPISAGKEHPF